MKAFTLITLCIASILHGEPPKEDSTWEYFTTLTTPSKDNISVRIITGPWDPTVHLIETKKDGAWKEIPFSADLSSEQTYRIDGRESIWGADGFGWPDREVKLFVIRWGEKVINVPQKHWRDYYWLLLYTQEETRKDSDIGGCWTHVRFDEATQRLIIVSNGGGGAGWYEVSWTVSQEGIITDSASSKGE
ncbi:hypothetical protein WJU23_04715 [Prosthecobacter sp. SYSU 5D2]|uniref:hypothetical protein n=1 Tax=Prosthecobacter sp. SYSU 5D2 TaxID=3134134 RepID=UPI0031FF0011